MCTAGAGRTEKSLSLFRRARRAWWVGLRSVSLSFCFRGASRLLFCGAGGWQARAVRERERERERESPRRDVEGAEREREQQVEEKGERPQVFNLNPPETPPSFPQRETTDTACTHNNTSSHKATVHLIFARAIAPSGTGPSSPPPPPPPPRARGPGKTDQNRSVSSPAPVTTVWPSGAAAK